MSDRGRDVVRYIKAVERGPEHATHWAESEVTPGFFYQWLGPPTNRDWARAYRMDLFDPFENMRAAMRYLERYEARRALVD